MKNYEVFLVWPTDVGLPYDTGSTFFVRPSQGDVGRYITIYPEHWKIEPLVQDAGGRKLPCNPVVLHHAKKVQDPEVVAAIPPPSEWKKLPFIPDYSEAHPYNTAKWAEMDTRKGR